VKSFIAALRTLVLPFGATTGRRIVLDGIAGTISIYDASDLLRVRLGASNDGLELWSGQADEFLAGNVQGLATGSPLSATRRMSTTLESGAFNGRSKAIIDLTSESFDGTIDPLAAYIAKTHIFAADVGEPVLQLGTTTNLYESAANVLRTDDTLAALGLLIGADTNLFRDVADTLRTNDSLTVDGTLNGTTDVQHNGVSLPRGGLTTRTQTTDMTATSGTTEKDIFTSAPDAVVLPAGRAIRLTLSIRSITASVANDIYSVRIKEGATQLMEQNFRAVAAAVGSDGMTLTVTLDSSYNAPSAGSHSYKATIVRAAGTGTATIQGAAGRPIQFTVDDVGSA